ncbi:hypothetical protein CEXT_261721 [Caerostris extrusa]|uniref:Uncharacterized protein n=1 Tax=Caerostris extrusa TaxID=172846 RepID=A0AAV4PHC9_CAEEX|nr:hypothetical protein CEXT_261721 [Caerostris extrusa]
MDLNIQSDGHGLVAARLEILQAAGLKTKVAALARQEHSSWLRTAVYLSTEELRFSYRSTLGPTPIATCI